MIQSELQENSHLVNKGAGQKTESQRDAECVCVLTTDEVNDEAVMNRAGLKWKNSTAKLI